MDDGNGDDSAAAAMAATMGFSSLGTQKANKRRKFNPTSTGSNMTPLGARNRNGNRNVDEIDLDMDDDHEEKEGGMDGEGEGHHSTMPTRSQPAQHKAADEDFEPPYLDTSRPSAPLSELAHPSAADDDLQSKINAIVSGSVDAADTNTNPQEPSSALNSDLPVRDGHGEERYHRNTNINTKRDDRSNTKKWWEGYYDPSFITNPWEKLEQVNDIEPRGWWLSWEEAKAKASQV